MSAKVCVITTVHASFDICIFHKEAKSLARAGYDVLLSAQHEKAETMDGVKIIALPKRKGRLGRILGPTWRDWAVLPKGSGLA